MPRRRPGKVRAVVPGLPSGAATSTLFVSRCPGSPICAGIHTYLFVDGLDVITRSHSGAVGLHPRQLLRPGGPLYPTDAVRDVDVASVAPSEPDTGGLVIRVGLKNEMVVWTDLTYPDLQGRPVEEVRFDLQQYLGEIGRAYREWIAADGQDSLTGAGDRSACGPVE